jgi:HlyD family secretion protein
MRDRFRVIMVFILLFTLDACSGDKAKIKAHTLTIQSHPHITHLFYTGIIQPLKASVIESPADGVVVEMPFQYGEAVNKGDLLFVISSTKFLTDYKTALMQYVKAKSEFNTSQSQLSESRFLYQHKLISDDEYKNKKTSYYVNQLALLQAKDVLENLIQLLDIKNINLYKLTIADIDKITEAMHLKKNSENLRLLSQVSGIVLSPVKNDEESKKLSKGDTIKQGDVLAVIGDMTGLIVKIKVNELTVNQLKLDQKVKITGIAFPEESLRGKIIRIDRQGDSANGGLPTFFVQVAVHQLNSTQQKNIHVGMSAKIEINIEEPSEITVPLLAVIEKNGLTFVNVHDKKTDQVKQIPVKTGKTTVDTVVILAGLKQGDTLIVPD